ncbi:MAG: hypothetical protein LBS59_04680 [Puniceicoccales bacterium]|jgi:hypothetical protein|nr:hypothetical protein [Puniceicoccales bacterium]
MANAAISIESGIVAPLTAISVGCETSERRVRGVGEAVSDESIGENANSITRWTDELEVEFDDLAKKNALQTLTKIEQERFDFLESKRGHFNMSIEERLSSIKRASIQRQLLQDLRKYEQFFDPAYRKKAHA